MTEVTPIATPATAIKSAVATQSHPLVVIAIFCGIGLLLSLAVLIADQKLPGEWF